ncbi:MAG: mechanosensitive ion channel family protein [Lentisphaeria bacterium]|nr:mechanosensitive ion channel family protein [Lentisphaeria bacterium]
MLTAINTWINETLGLSPAIQTKIAASLLIILVLMLIRGFVLRLISRKFDEVRLQYRWRKTANYIIYWLGFLLVAAIWFQAFQSVGTFLGLVSAGLTIALRDLVTGVAGWAFILWRRPFEVGDRIEIGNLRGDVIDLRVFQFTLLEIGNWVDADQSTGRIIHIPNGRVLSEAVANYSKGFQFIWHEIPILVTFESDWRKAKGILQDIADKHCEQLSHEAEKQVRQAAQKYMIFYKTLTPTVYTSAKDSGVLLTVRYLCRPQKRRGTEQLMWEDILDAFNAEPTIDLAYPTTRFYQS